MKFLTKENILFDRQYGFQKNKATSLAILDIYTKIVSCGIFLDFATAFDTANHSILLQKMGHCGIRGLPLSWFTSYLSKRHQAVKINNNMWCAPRQCSWPFIISIVR